jgi:hypothetical protein
MKKILVAMLAAALILTACGNGGDAAGDNFSAATVEKTETAPVTTAETTAKTTRERVTEAEVKPAQTPDVGAIGAPNTEEDPEGNSEFQETIILPTKPTAAADMTGMYGTWNLDNKSGGETITFNEDGTYERVGGTNDSGTYEIKPYGYYLNGYGSVDTVHIELETETSFVTDEYGVFPGNNIIYGYDIFNDLSVYALPGTDSADFDYYSKLAKLITSTYQNDNYAVSFFEGGMFSVDSITKDGNTIIWQNYTYGSYEVNDDFTSLHIKLGDGSFEGDCPVNIAANTISTEPFGDIEAN